MTDKSTAKIYMCTCPEIIGGHIDDVPPDLQDQAAAIVVSEAWVRVLYDFRVLHGLRTVMIDDATYWRQLKTTNSLKTAGMFFLVDGGHDREHRERLEQLSLTMMNWYVTVLRKWTSRPWERCLPRKNEMKNRPKN